MIEDTCESLGSNFKNKKLGTFGDFGTYSFYYSHQISSGEGGMVVCNDKNDYRILLSLRAHGWSRDRDDHKKILRKNSQLDPRFVFVNYGFNLRPLEIQAAIANQQLKKINTLKKNRNFNRFQIIKLFKMYKRNNEKLIFIDDAKNVECNWFGIPILLAGKFKKSKKNIIQMIEKKGIETRPIISGNILNQPAINLFKLNKKKTILKNCQDVEDRGFFIGINSVKTDERMLKFVANSLNSVLDKFK